MAKAASAKAASTRTASQGHAAAVELTVRWAGRPRTLALGRWRGLLLIVALPILAAWYLCASLYLVFHDDLLAALIARQTEAQYSYEDRIAALKAELDTAAGADSEEASSGALGELRARGARLEARAAALEQLAGKLGLGAATAPALPPAPALHLGRGEATPGAVAIGQARAEAAQDAAIRGLREPAMRKVATIENALAETGLPASRWRGAGIGDDVGGPFVPLEGRQGSDASLALVQSLAQEASRLDAIVDRVPLRRPLAGSLEVTSTFGPRVDPFLGRPAMHTGIDLHEQAGDAVAATASGTVTIAGPDGGYGNMVEVDHGGGLATRYAHLSAIEVAVGRRVTAGDIVGRVGSTGRATGPHLHYETRIDGVPVDPARFLRASAILSPER